MIFNDNTYENLMTARNSGMNVLGYDEYIERIKYICVCSGDGNNYFIIPDWKHMIKELDLSPEYCIEEITYEDIYIILQLERDRLNILNSDTSKISKFIVRLCESISEEEALRILSEEVSKANAEINNSDE